MQAGANPSDRTGAALTSGRKPVSAPKEIGLHEGLQRAWDIIGEHGEHPDMMEGATAFIEKRKPRWAGFSD